MLNMLRRLEQLERREPTRYAVKVYIGVGPDDWDTEPNQDSAKQYLCFPTDEAFERWKAEQGPDSDYQHGGYH